MNWFGQGASSPPERKWAGEVGECLSRRLVSLPPSLPLFTLESECFDEHDDDDEYDEYEYDDDEYEYDDDEYEYDEYHDEYEYDDDASHLIHMIRRHVG